MYWETRDKEYIYMNGIEISAVGNLTRDAELRFSGAGRAWATFSIAVNEIQTVNGERKDKVTYLNCKIFSDQAENMVETLGKGDRVIVTGKLEEESWADKDGTERRRTVVRVDEIGPSLRWATAQVTKKASNANPQGAPVKAASGDFSKDNTEPDGNPFGEFSPF